MTDDSTTRRGFLTASTVALRPTAAVGAATVATAGVASADHMDQKPAHVSLSYDESTLKQYRPRFKTDHLDFKPNALYSWVASSPEHDTAACVYCAAYDAQHGLSPFAGPLSDSHAGDHEWFYVFISTKTGDVDHVVYTAYHWLAGRMYAGIPTDDDGRVTARIVKPWHHYIVAPLEDEDGGSLVELGDLSAVFEDWLDHGMEEDLAPGTAVNPWSMDQRESWWRTSIGGTSFNEVYVKAMLATGFFGADASDLTG